MKVSCSRNIVDVGVTKEGEKVYNNEWMKKRRKKNVDSRGEKFEKILLAFYVLPYTVFGAIF
jgi:hypothetical protein